MKHKFNLFDGINISILLLISFTMLYPFVNILAISLNNAMDTQAGGIYFLPRKFSIQSYIVILQTPSLVTASLVTVSRTIIGTFLTVFCTAMYAYTFTKRDFIIYKPMKVIFFAALFFGGGGLIPTYMLYKDLALIDNYLVYILPNLINLFFVLIIRTYFMQLPYGLTESAMLDGANELVIFFRIVFPLSAPIIAFIALNTAVRQWNSWQDTLFFTNGGSLKSLQYVMMEVMLKSETRQMMTRELLNLRKAGISNAADPKSIRMAITILVTLPIVMVYPFLQKYFIKGIMIGSMKG
jgi:putative aldouronate transport system permease protein